MWCILKCLLVLVCTGHLSAIPLRLFYPYGTSRGDVSLTREDDVSSPEIQLQTPVHFYDGFYTSIFINSNGHVSFESEVPVYQPTMVMPLNLELKLVSAYMADIDLSIGGNVLYRESTEESLLERAAADVQGHFSQFPSFEPLGLYIVTWDKVPAFGMDPAETSTFQIVIASDELNSFVIFNYLDDGLGWVQSKGKFSSVGSPDPPAQAGFDSGDGSLFYKLPNSGLTYVTDLSRDSNVNVPGQWMYHIGNTKGSNIGGPDLGTGDVTIFIPEIDQLTCIGGGGRTCHKEATCEDYDNGFCCQCVSPSYGNGLNCIKPEEPQRLNGKVSGVINGVVFEDLDMHAFVVTKDGRAYTAISRIPDEISPQFMTLNTIGGMIGWLFAVKHDTGAKNGYMYTGGQAERTARINYQRGGEVVITQKYFGHNVLNNIRLETYINGTIPDMGKSDRITVDDYHEEYKRVGPGRIRSTSDRTFRANEIANRYTWDQDILFEECEHAPVAIANGGTMRLSVSRNFVVYDATDRVVRFATSNSIREMTGSDPCVEGQQNCDLNADCIPSGRTYKCECKTGFVGDGDFCEDLDECGIALISTCDENARCTNVPGSFTCQCNSGYRGDGRTCTRFAWIDVEGSGETTIDGEVSLCGENLCDTNARCVFNDVEDKPMCECKAGYSGDGTYCNQASFECNEVDICHENAVCVYSDVTASYQCECPEGFSGDGSYCESTRIDTLGCNCDSNADCTYDIDMLAYHCVCKPGYTGSGQECSKIRAGPECDDCHPNADCVFDQSAQAYRCRCEPGYQGDGTRCVPYDCRDSDLCDVNARCTQDSDGNYVCECAPGYRGDGRRCEPEGCNVLNNCAVDAQCLPDPRDTSRYMCRCNAGYSGDGQVCIRRVIPCNQFNNCSRNGQCLYDPATLDYKCRCNRGYDGDGFTCTPRGADCMRDSGLCDRNADCMLNVDTFICVCNQGYRGDGYSCERMSMEMNYLLFSRGYTLHKVPYTQNGVDSHGTRVLYVPDELAVSVTADCVEQEVYWSDVSNGRISRAGLDGFEKEVVARGFSSPEGLAIDWVSRNIYVTDSGLDAVFVVSINGTNRKTLVRGGMRDPRSIVVDPQRGVMYWTDWYRNSPAIEQAHMDGSERQVFVEADLSLPNGLTLDPYSQQLCWGDAGTHTIECIRTDGVGRRTITEDAPYPFDIALNGNTIYWSDWSITGIPNVDINNSEQMEPLSLPVGGNGRLYGITSVGDFCPRVTNACYRGNGGCRYFCLPTPNGGRTCTCPDDVDEVTCSEIATLK